MSFVGPARRLLAALIAAAIAVQFFLAGAGAFGATSFDPHRALGTALIPAALVLALLAGLARRDVPLSMLLVVLLALQLGLAALAADSTAWLGALHGLTAVAVLAVAGNLTRRAFQL